MPASTPEELHSLYAERMAAGDLDSLVDLYEEAATFNGGQVGPVRGRDAIGRRLTEFLAWQPTFHVRTRAVIEAEGVALLASDWHFVATADGSTVERRGTSVEVARRQPDGTWLYLIDEPSFLEPATQSGPHSRSARE